MHNNKSKRNSGLVGIAKNKGKGILRISRANERNVGETSSDMDSIYVFDTFVAQNFSRPFFWLFMMIGKGKGRHPNKHGWNKEGFFWGVCWVGGILGNLKTTMGIWESLEGYYGNFCKSRNQKFTTINKPESYCLRLLHSDPDRDWEKLWRLCELSWRTPLTRFFSSFYASSLLLLT